MRRFYLDSAPENNTACIRGDEARHIEKVLRLGPGDSVELFCADGSVYRAVIESLNRGELIARICERTSREPDMGPLITSGGQPVGFFAGGTMHVQREQA
jgi:RsmE family RNA methyltransferase